MFRNVNSRNLKNVLQRNLRTGRTRERIFRASGGTNFENFSAQRRTGLPKKTLDTSLAENCFVGKVKEFVF